MCTLSNLTKACGSQLPPGTKQKLYLVPVAELTEWPDTMDVTGNGTGAAGESKILDEEWSFVTTQDLGFWRTIDILVDSGDLRNVMEGEIGGQGYRQRLDFFVLGNNSREVEFADCLLANSGCMIAMVPDKAGNYHVLGDLDNPVYIEAAEGGTGGDRVGFQYTLYANTGKTTYIYNADDHGINVTPNA